MIVDWRPPAAACRRSSVNGSGVPRNRVDSTSDDAWYHLSAPDGDGPPARAPIPVRPPSGEGCWMEERPGGVMTIDDLPGYPRTLALDALRTGSGRRGPGPEGRSSMAVPEAGDWPPVETRRSGQGDDRRRGRRRVTRPLSEDVIEKIGEAGTLYYRLVLVVGAAGAGKTGALREVRRPPRRAARQRQPGALAPDARSGRAATPAPDRTLFSIGSSRSAAATSSCWTTSSSSSIPRCDSTRSACCKTSRGAGSWPRPGTGLSKATTFAMPYPAIRNTAAIHWTAFWPWTPER